MTQLHYQPTEHVYGCNCRKCRQHTRRQYREARPRSHGRHSTWGFREELSPCGTHDFRVLYSGTLDTGIDFSDVLVTRVPSHPWFLIVWEPLLTKAPSPANASPYCCYSRTVIFYHRPYMVVRQWHGSPGCFADYGQIETRLNHDFIVEFEGERFKQGSGRVVWKRRRWWMVWWARRERKQSVDRDLPPHIDSRYPNDVVNEAAADDMPF